MKWTYFGFQAAKLNLRELALKPLIGDNNTLKFWHLGELLTKARNCNVYPKLKIPQKSLRVLVSQNNALCVLLNNLLPDAILHGLIQILGQIYYKSQTRSGLAPGVTDLSDGILIENTNKR